MIEVAQCRVCGGMYNIHEDGYFKRPHGPRIQRCRGGKQRALGYGPSIAYVKSPLNWHVLGKV